MTISSTARKLLRAALVLSGLLASTTYAAGPTQESELIALSNAWIDAEVHHDKAALERLLDERFLVTFASGKTVDRTAFVDRIMNSEIKPFAVLNEVVNVHEDHGAVIPHGPQPPARADRSLATLLRRPIAAGQFGPSAATSYA